MATIKSVVAWCPECLIYFPLEEIGMICGMDCARKLIKRVGYICPEPDCLWFYRTVREIKNCPHGMY
jgi:hypothetical protein